MLHKSFVPKSTRFKFCFSCFAVVLTVVEGFTQAKNFQGFEIKS